MAPLRPASLLSVLCAAAVLRPADAQGAYGEGFVVFLNKKGINKADIEFGTTEHYGDDVDMPDERAGCSVDPNSQSLIYATLDDSQKSWTLWKFAFAPQATDPGAPEKVASLRTQGRMVKGLAVDPKTRSVYISVEEPTGFYFLKLDDYEKAGATLTKGGNAFTTGVEALGGEGGSIAIIHRTIFVLHAKPGGGKAVSKNNLESPDPAWAEVPSVGAAIPQAELLGDMVGSDVDEMLYISTDAGAWPGALYAVDSKGASPPVKHEGRVSEFGYTNRPTLTAVGDVVAMYVTAYLAKTKSEGNTLTRCNLEGDCDPSANQIAQVGPSEGPVGPICWSGPIRPRTDAPSTAPATPAPDTTAPNVTDTDVPDTPEPQVGNATTDAPVNATSPEPAVPPVEETGAPPTPVPDAQCALQANMVDCKNRVGCEWFSDVEKSLLAGVAVPNASVSPFLQGICIPWGSKCPGQGEPGCQILTSCFWESGAGGGSCLVSSQCPHFEGKTKCDKDPVQCRWDHASHTCTVNLEEEEPADDKPATLLLIALITIGVACLCVAVVCCCVARLKRVGDEFDGNVKREKWYREADKEEQMMADPNDGAAQLEEVEDPLQELNRQHEMELQKHHGVLEEFEVEDVIPLARDDVYTPPPPDPDTDESDYGEEDEQMDALLAIKPDTLDADDLFGPLSTKDGALIHRTERERQLMQAIQEKRQQLDDAVLLPTPQQEQVSLEQKRREALRGNLEAALRDSLAQSQRNSGRFQLPLSARGSIRKVAGTGSQQDTPSLSGVSSRRGADGLSPGASQSTLCLQTASSFGDGTPSNSNRGSLDLLGSPLKGSPSHHHHQSSRICSELADGLTKVDSFTV